MIFVPTCSYRSYPGGNSKNLVEQRLTTPVPTVPTYIYIFIKKGIGQAQRQACRLLSSVNVWNSVGTVGTALEARRKQPFFADPTYGFQVGTTRLIGGNSHV